MRILAILFFLLSVTGTAVSSEYFNRVDCFPEPDVTAEKCTQRKCQWDPPGCDAPENTPPCYFPTTTGYTHVREETEDSNTVYILKRNIDLAENSKNPPNPYVNDDEREDDLKVSTSYYGPALRVRIEPNGDGKRYEPTSVLLDQKLSVENELHFKVIETDSIFSFTVERNSTGARLWDTSIGGMLFADQYIQIATLLPTDKMYGWGENAHQTLKHDFSKYKTWGMFGRDQPPQSVGEQTLNLYGVQPFYMALESDHKAHGVFILNANAQEVTTGPNSHFVYRTIGGILDIFFLPGPTPEEVVKQFEMLVGKPFMPAYFALGFQLSRYGYKDLDDMKAAVDRTINAGIPLEVPYADIDYMMHFTDFTLSEGFQQLGEYTKEIHSKGMKLFLMFDVGIDVTSPPFKRALEQGANFIQWPENNSVPKDVQSMYSTTNNTDFMLGVVWPNNHCAFPDFLDPENNTAEWWISEFREYHKNISFDGIWIDMNEPAVFGTNLDNPWYFTDPDHPYKIKPIYCNFTDNLKKYDYPKFKTHNVYVYDDDTLLLSDKTLCMRAKTNRGEQLLYDTKSLYALYEARYTHKALELVIGKRGAIITRANYPGIGQYSGHWLGDNNATWSDLLTSIVGIQEYNIFGIPYIGSDICGFHGNTTEELCLRWHQLGAFYTFSRNHNGKPYIKQDPAQWESVKSATKKAYNFRYRYLPYLYSLHFDAHLNGGSVIRPVFFEFPDDEKTHSLGMQFMWGKAMMIIPVYTEGDTSVEGYLPESSFWYSLRDDDYGYQVPNTQTNFSAKLDEMIPVFIRGGSIVTTQDPAMTTDKARKNPMKLIVAMNNFETVDDRSVAVSEGFLYWDDGVTKVSENKFCRYNIRLITTESWSTLNIRSETMNGDCERKPVTAVDIFGYPCEPDPVFLIQNDIEVSPTPVNYTYDSSSHILHLEAVNNGALMTFKKTVDQKLIWRMSKNLNPTSNETSTVPTSVPTNPSTRPSTSSSISVSTATTSATLAPTTSGSNRTVPNIKSIVAQLLFVSSLLYFMLNCRDFQTFPVA